MPFVDPAYFATVHWGQREDEQRTIMSIDSRDTARRACAETLTDTRGMDDSHRPMSLPAAAPRGMGIDWMDADGLAEAIPPAYTEALGRALLQAMGW